MRHYVTRSLNFTGALEEVNFFMKQATMADEEPPQHQAVACSTSRSISSA